MRTKSTRKPLPLAARVRIVDAIWAQYILLLRCGAPADRCAAARARWERAS